MSKNIRLLIGVIAFLLSWGFCINSFAEAGPTLSFIPLQSCKRPPVSPPPRLLSRSYKTYMQVGNWAIFDINGDGWCDWVRGGHEGYRTDNEEPPMRDFIYLGTSKGWRHFDQAKPGEKSKAHVGGYDAQNIISEHHNALNFYQPIAIYRKSLAKPYIATVTRYDAPAPPPNRDQIEVYQWSDQLDKLLKVSEAETSMVLDFLQNQLCRNPPTLMDGEGRFILAMGDLCFPSK